MGRFVNLAEIHAIIPRKLSEFRAIIPRILPVSRISFTVPPDNFMAYGTGCFVFLSSVTWPTMQVLETHACYHVIVDLL